MSTSGGEPVRVPAASIAMLPLNVSPDGAELLVRDIQGTEFRGELWSLPILGGSPRRLGGLVAQDAALSPDGRMLVYADGNELFLARSDGTESRKLVSLTGLGFYPAWSPAGNKLRFTVLDQKTEWAIHSGKFRRRGRICIRCFPDGTIPQTSAAGNGRRTENTSSSNLQGQIWALSEQGAFLHQPTGKPIQLTSSPLRLFAPLPSKDGKKLFVVGQTYRGELERGESKSGQFTPFLSGISAEDVAFSKDGQWVAYVSYPEGILWRSKPDGSEKVQLSSPSAVGSVAALVARRQTDRIRGQLPGKPRRVYLVSADGGGTQLLLPEDPEPQWDPDWSPDGGQDSRQGQSG